MSSTTLSGKQILSKSLSLLQSNADAVRSGNRRLAKDIIQDRLSIDVDLEQIVNLQDTRRSLFVLSSLDYNGSDFKEGYLWVVDLNNGNPYGKILINTNNRQLRYINDKCIVDEEIERSTDIIKALQPRYKNPLRTLFLGIALAIALLLVPVALLSFDPSGGVMTLIIAFVFWPIAGSLQIIWRASYSIRRKKLLEQL